MCLFCFVCSLFEAFVVVFLNHDMILNSIKAVHLLSKYASPVVASVGDDWWVHLMSPTDSSYIGESVSKNMEFKSSLKTLQKFTVFTYFNINVRILLHHQNRFDIYKPCDRMNQKAECFPLCQWFILYYKLIIEKRVPRKKCKLCWIRFFQDQNMSDLVQ